MTVAVTRTKAEQALTQQFESVAGRLPDRIDLDNAAHTRLLAELGLTPDGMFDELGAEL